MTQFAAIMAGARALTSKTTSIPESSSTAVVTAKLRELITLTQPRRTLVGLRNVGGARRRSIGTIVLLLGLDTDVFD